MREMNIPFRFEQALNGFRIRDGLRIIMDEETGVIIAEDGFRYRRIN